MRNRKPLTASLTAGLLVITLTPAGSAAANPPGPGAVDAAVVLAGSVDPSRTVTLITGDRVVVVDEGGVAVQRGAGRDDVTFLAQRDGGHQYVIPSDALALVAAGRLDRRLFDVSLLREYGYDDGRADLPLIVTHQDPLSAISRAGGVRAVRDLPVVEGAAVRVDKAAATTFWRDLVAATPAAGPAAAGAAEGPRVWLDGMLQPLLDQSVPQVGAPAAWAQGLDGTGMRVAVLDTGIDVTHPDLAGRVVGQANFTEGFEDDRDLVGHGTHVASTVVGSGAASGGRYRGVAPGAGLLNGKVCVEFGCAHSWVLAGMQWAAEQGADVVNLSLGGPDTPGLDPLEEAVGTLSAQYGVLFVIAAGNSGADASISSPGSADAALTVGAVDKVDQLGGFSSRGPRLDGGLKPDLTAPGVDIVAANSKDGFLGEPGQPYTTLSGTSMATPHVAGAAAILAQQHPDWSPEQLKAGLMGSAVPHPDLGAYAQGAGRLDVARAVGQSVTANPPGVGFELALWPHEDDQPQTRTISYRNHGTAEVSLELAVATIGPDGQPAPDGMFTLSDSRVTIPAGGGVEVSLTADTTLGDLDGYLGGRITATGSGQVVTTPFAIEREAEIYDLTLVHTDRTGAPSGFVTDLVRLDAFVGIPDFVIGFGTVTLRVLAGEYTLLSFVGQDEEEEEEEETDGGSVEESTLLAYPRLVIDRDQTVAVDARLGQPISVTVPDPEAAPAQSGVSAEVDAEGVFASFEVSGSTFDGIFAGQLGPEQTVDGFASVVSSTWAQPHPDGGFRDTPYTYDLAWFEVGRMITGFTRDVKRSELATVRADHAAHVPGATGWTSTGGRLGIFASPSTILLPAELPFRRTEYRNTGGGVQWTKTFREMVPGDEGFPETVSSAESVPTEYQAGHQYLEDWNYGVFGPVLPRHRPTEDDQLPDRPVISRLGDRLEVESAMYGDRAGRPLSTRATGSISVFRDGELLAQVPDLSGSVEVPPEPADYRVEIEAARDERFPLSRQTSLVWTFRSGHVEADEPVRLPVWAVRFTPWLDAHNTAPAGGPFLVPVQAVSQPGSDAGELASLSVEVSFDDGQSWQEAALVDGMVRLFHPEGGGSVSLRSTATDSHGNSVTQTVIRAYQIG